MRLFDRSLLSAAALAAGLAISASGAMAQSWYVKGLGGLTFPQDDNFQVNASGGGSFDSGLNYDTGYALAIAGGYMFTPSIAFELEYAFRTTDAKLKDPGGPDPDGTTESNAWMANAIYYFPPMGAGGSWRPYAGGGLGAADLKIKDLPSYIPGGSFESDYNFAYQLIGGVAYSWSPAWTMNMEARFFGINDQDVENGDFKFKTTYQTFDLLFGATYHF
jgi:opacity protein-like surface antigen